MFVCSRKELFRYHEQRIASYRSAEKIVEQREGCSVVSTLMEEADEYEETVEVTITRVGGDGNGWTGEFQAMREPNREM